MAERVHILVLCTGNSCRSQMAEGILNTFYGTIVRAESAGSRPAGYVHPLAIKAMAEIGVDLSQGTSKNLSMFLGQSFDAVVTVCDNAAEDCPVFPGGGKRIHRSFDDPASATGDDVQQMQAFRRVRDEIRLWAGDLVRDVTRPDEG